MSAQTTLNIRRRTAEIVVDGRLVVLRDETLTMTRTIVGPSPEAHPVHAADEAMRRVVAERSRAHVELQRALDCYRHAAAGADDMTDGLRLVR